MGKLRQRVETQGYTSRNVQWSQDFHLDVIDAEICVLNNIMFKPATPSPARLSAVLSLDPGNNHSSPCSASPNCRQCVWSAGGLAVVCGNVSKPLLFVLHILYVE